jgi:hypothetical protein
MEKQTVSGKKEKNGFDEQTLAKILEAAYVVQEHNRVLRETQEREAQQTGAESQNPPLTPAAAASTAASELSSAKAPPSAQASAKEDYAVVLAQIVETQQQIQTQHLDLEHAMALIAERALEIANAAGAGGIEGSCRGQRSPDGEGTVLSLFANWPGDSLRQCQSGISGGCRRVRAARD